VRFQPGGLHGLRVATRTSAVPGEAAVADETDPAVPHRDQVLRELGRASDVVDGHAVVVLELPVSDDVVARHGKRNAPVPERAQQAHRMRAAEDHSADAIFTGQRWWQPQIPGRRAQIAAKGNELQIPAVLIAVRLGAEQYERLELVEIVAVAEDERDDARLPLAREIDAQLPGGVEDPRLYRRVDLRVPVGNARHRCGADVCDLGNVVQGSFHGSDLNGHYVTASRSDLGIAGYM